MLNGEKKITEHLSIQKIEGATSVEHHISMNRKTNCEFLTKLGTADLKLFRNLKM